MWTRCSAQESRDARRRGCGRDAQHRNQGTQDDRSHPGEHRRGRRQRHAACFRHARDDSTDRGHRQRERRALPGGGQQHRRHPSRHRAFVGHPRGDVRDLRDGARGGGQAPPGLQGRRWTGAAWSSGSSSPMRRARSGQGPTRGSSWMTRSSCPRQNPRGNDPVQASPNSNRITGSRRHPQRTSLPVPNAAGSDPTAMEHNRIRTPAGPVSARVTANSTSTTARFIPV